MTIEEANRLFGTSYLSWDEVPYTELLRIYAALRIAELGATVILCRSDDPSNGWGFGAVDSAKAYDLRGMR